jgi:hypothetical protein
MPRRSPPRKVTYFEPVPPRLGRNTIIESTIEVGRRFRCTMRIDCGELNPSAVIPPVPGEWVISGRMRCHHYPFPSSHMARSVARRSATAPLPEWIRPPLTQLLDAAPDGPDWLHEIKFDGYRMHAYLDRGGEAAHPHRARLDA